MARFAFRRALATVVVALLSAAPDAVAGTATHAQAWGDNADGELGNGTVTRYGGLPTPVQVSNLTGATSVAAGSDFSLALKSDGTVWAWGNSGWGQLGQGTYGSSTTPVRVTGLSGVTQVAAGDLTGLALKSDGTVRAWGFNYYGQVGNGASGNNVLAPVQVVGLTGVVAIASGNGGNTSYALKADGTVWAWGYDGLGQLGNGTSNETAHPRPVEVSNLSGAVAIGAGSEHALAVLSDGTVRAWGSNQYGQLGARTSTSCSVYHYPCSTVPVQVTNLAGVSAVAGGGNFSLALKSDGSVWGWGQNDVGQLANGTTTSSGGVTTPTRAHLQSIIAIAAGDQHTLALKSDGTVWAAGSNSWGQLGTGTFTGSSNPVRVVNLSGAVSIAAGLDHSLAVVP
jgi:alpha-tubulin suppressor-like RCC1 family protein